MERDARFALFCQDQQFEMAACEHQRQGDESNMFPNSMTQWKTCELKTSTPHKPHLSSSQTSTPPVQSLFHSNIVQVKTFSFVFRRQLFWSLHCVTRADILGFCCFSAVALRIAAPLLGKESHCMPIPHSCIAHLKHSMVLWLQKTNTFHR